MINGLVNLLIFQGLGESLSMLTGKLVPGPILGMVLLLGFLFLRGRVDADLDQVATAFTQNLGLLFIPAAVGVVIFLPQLIEHAGALAVVLTLSVVCAIAATALVIRLFSKGQS